MEATVPSGTDWRIEDRGRARITEEIERKIKRRADEINRRKKN